VANYLAWGIERSAALAHALGMPGLADPIGYLEVDGVRHCLGRGPDETRARKAGFEVISLTALGWRELQDANMPFEQAMAELVLRACRSVDVTDVRVPDDFPLLVLDHLRANGVAVELDAEEFWRRRRSKTPEELEGVLRGQTAAYAAVGHVRTRLKTPGPDLTVQNLRQEMIDIYAAHGCEPHWDFLVVAPGATSADGMNPGSLGPIPEGAPVLIDAAPRDFVTGMWGDTCRVYITGDAPAPPDYVEWHAAVLEALDAAKATVAPGAAADAPHRAAYAVLEEAGRSIFGDKPAGSFRFGNDVGHGIGLDLHEAPHISYWGGSEKLVPGDVIALEPAVYVAGEWGIRLEDVVVVTEGGYERIGDYDFDL
jgi:Xaa-Pro aminopeptidase